MAKYLIAGNWKMNSLPSQIAGFVNEFVESSTWNRDDVEVAIAMPSTHLDRGASVLKETSIKLSAQNVHWEAAGAYTGEISIAMLKDLGVTWTLLGHSERRQYYGETDESVTKKFVSCIKESILPVVCCGETKEERESGKTQEVVKRQLTPVIAKADQNTNFVIAYEPVWAIGTGLTASNEQAQEVHAFIRKLLKESLGDRADQIKILYGGSAKPGNIKGLLEQNDIDGALVGGASLKSSDFGAMVATASEL